MCDVTCCVRNSVSECMDCYRMCSHAGDPTLFIQIAMNEIFIQIWCCFKWTIPYIFVQNVHLHTIVMLSTDCMVTKFICNKITDTFFFQFYSRITLIWCFKRKKNENNCICFKPLEHILDLFAVHLWVADMVLVCWQEMVVQWSRRHLPRRMDAFSSLFH